MKKLSVAEDVSSEPNVPGRNVHQTNFAGPSVVDEVSAGEVSQDEMSQQQNNEYVILIHAKLSKSFNFIISLMKGKQVLFV